MDERREDSSQTVNKIPEATLSHDTNVPTVQSETSSVHTSAPHEALEQNGATADVQAESLDEAQQLAELTAGMRSQDDLERDIGRQADELLTKQADERDQKRLDKTTKDKDRLVGQVRRLEKKLTEFGNHTTKNRYREEIRNYEAQITVLDKDLEQIQKRISGRQGSKDDADQGEKIGDSSTHRLAGETQREFLIRTGKITPFSKTGRSILKSSESLGEVLLHAEEDEGEDDDANEENNLAGEEEPTRSHRHLLAPGFEQDDSSTVATPDATDGDAELAKKLQDEEFASARPTKRRRLQSRRVKLESDDEQRNGSGSDAEFTPTTRRSGSESDQWDQASVDDVALDTEPLPQRGKRAKTAIRTKHEGDDEHEDLAGIDDGNETVYQTRLRDWTARRRAARHKVKSKLSSSDDIEREITESDEDTEHIPEWHRPHPTRTDAEFEGGYRMPGDIYLSLFNYQKTGVQWLWELYSQQVGGIIGDEMGLGKTIQIISFLAGLHYSDRLTKPIIVVCPATLMKQWVNEFHRWWPPLRVSILHSSGSGMLDITREARDEEDLETTTYSKHTTRPKGYKAAKRIIDKVFRDGHVLVTTYTGLKTHAEQLIPIEWGYAVLDEGHQIRNPNSEVTIYCKELRTHNRVILSGTPMQNNLTELWSLFDFVFPMRLGTLVNFRNQFEIPIKQGGYANASNLQVETAMKCAETLKDAISPYLLQRFKMDVASDLPKKSERVLFCKLTRIQREAYEWFLNSDDMKSIMAGKRQALYGVDILRKICNHPDLVDHRNLSKNTKYRYGDPTKSGKMQVVKALLEIWRQHGHKTLLFAQHVISLNILEKLIKSMPGVRYLRMDGGTAIKERQALVDQFNNDEELHVFLLTTKVGGLGVNLTGANRVIIYDPDWNPSTDMQARERSWRLGQKREVEIYRLMTAGTIEEKIYHRQIFKQFLTNKILKDPKQRQTFQLRDLHDLFTLTDTAEGQTETSSIFKGTEVKLRGADAASSEENHLPTPPQDGASPAVELAGIAGISRDEKYHDEAELKKADGDASIKDDRMLSSIFAHNGVQSALEHDAIINGKRAVRADPEMVAREAKRVAAEAARELQRARDIARTVPAGVPTWTGEVGSAGRPEDPVPFRSSPLPSRGRGGGLAGRGGRGPSSASVLANLQSRVVPSTSASTSRASTPGSSRQKPRGADFLVMIRDYLVAQGGEVYTQMLIDHFNRYCDTEQSRVEFKEMLKTIAVLDRAGGRNGRGKWILKDEYRPNATKV